MFNKLNVKVKKLNERATIPTYGSEKAAGADLYACLPEGVDSITVNPGETVKFGTGVAFELPEGFASLIMARSGLSTKHGLAPANKVGLCDEDYRGEYIVGLHNHSNTPYEVKHGERIAQLVIFPYIQGIFNEAEELSDTQRGAGAFGSTGKN